MGIDSRIVDQIAHRQDDSEWCWAASAQMILNLYGLTVTQQEIVQRIHGNQDNQAGSDDDITAALNGWAPFVGGRKIVHAEAKDGFPTAQELIQELSQGKPFLIAFRTAPNKGHAVVVTGAAFSRTISGVLVRALIIRDPWPSPEHVATSGRVLYNDDNLYAFSQTVRKYWTVTVSLEPVSFQPDLQQESHTRNNESRQEPTSKHPSNVSVSSEDDCKVAASGRSFNNKGHLIDRSACGLESQSAATHELQGFVLLADNHQLSRLSGDFNAARDEYLVLGWPDGFAKSDCSLIKVPDQKLSLDCSKR